MLLVRVHRQARRCLFTPTWQEDIWLGLKVHPTRKTYVTPVGQKKHLHPVIENVKNCQSLKPRRVGYPWIGETHFKVDTGHGFDPPLCPACGSRLCICLTHGLSLRARTIHVTSLSRMTWCLACIGPSRMRYGTSLPMGSHAWNRCRTTTLARTFLPCSCPRSGLIV